MQNSIEKYHQQFPDTCSVIVAIHAKDLQQVLHNVAVAVDQGAHGIALVTHDSREFSQQAALKVIPLLKEKYPYTKLLINLLRRSPMATFDAIADVPVDGVRVDNPHIGLVNGEHDDYADDIKAIQEQIGWNGLYLGGVNFKGQKQTLDEQLGYVINDSQAGAKQYLDVLTTSGPATGHAADADKVAFLKQIAGDFPVALASGVTPDNVEAYMQYVDAIIVATGINIENDFYNIDPKKLKALMSKVRHHNYTQSLFEDFKVDSLEQLAAVLASESYININAGSDISVESNLSNLAYSPFVLDDVEYASVEAFWQCIKYSCTDPRRLEIAALYGLEAKKAGRAVADITTLVYGNRETSVGSDDHHALLKRALYAKFTQNTHLKNMLLGTGDKSLVHVVFDKTGKSLLPDSRTIPAKKFCALLTELRKELQG